MWSPFIKRRRSTIKQSNILIIEKDESVAIPIAAALEGAGFQVIKTSDAFDGIRSIYQKFPDLIILDTGLSIINEENAYNHIREVSYLPIIVLGSQEEAAESLELGADVFMIKPPSLRELVARVRNLLKRKSKFDNDRMTRPPGANTNNLPYNFFNDFPKDPSIENNPMQHEQDMQDSSDGLKYFTSTEFRLAKYLINNEGHFIDYSRIIRDVWDGNKVSIDTIHFYVGRLRKKLQALFPHHIDIINYRGIGYRLEGQS